MSYNAGGYISHKKIESKKQMETRKSYSDYVTQVCLRADECWLVPATKLDWRTHKLLVTNDLEPNDVNRVLVGRDDLVEIRHDLKASLVFRARAVWTQADMEINNIKHLQKKKNLVSPKSP